PSKELFLAGNLRSRDRPPKVLLLVECRWPAREGQPGAPYEVPEPRAGPLVRRVGADPVRHDNSRTSRPRPLRAPLLRRGHVGNPRLLCGPGPQRPGPLVGLAS